MKSVLLVCVLACFALASATEVAVSVDAEGESEVEMDESNMDVADFDNAPFVPQNSEHDEVEVDDADEESSVSDEESDSADELEGNSEFELEDVETAFVEADAHAAAELEAETETETETDAESEADADRKGKGKGKAGKGKGKGKARGGKKGKGKPKGKGKGKALKKFRPKISGGKRFRPKPMTRFPSKPRKEFKYHSERQGKIEDPEMAKLNLALEAVKEDILSTNKQINTERQWVVAVAKIIAQYNEKMKRVEAHIISLRKEMKSLYRKKKQIENLKLQRALQDKLKQARGELGTLTSSLTKVQKKKGQLNKSGADLRVTIAGLQGQLAKLRGQKLFKPKASPKKCGKGKRYSKRAGKCVAKGKGKKSKKSKKAKKSL